MSNEKKQYRVDYAFKLYGREIIEAENSQEAKDLIVQKYGSQEHFKIIRVQETKVRYDD